MGNVTPWLHATVESSNHVIFFIFHLRALRERAPQLGKSIVRLTMPSAHLRTRIPLRVAERTELETCRYTHTHHEIQRPIPQTAFSVRQLGAAKRLRL